jgi:hypothetical protein
MTKSEYGSATRRDMIGNERVKGCFPVGNRAYLQYSDNHSSGSLTPRLSIPILLTTKDNNLMIRTLRISTSLPSRPLLIFFWNCRPFAGPFFLDPLLRDLYLLFLRGQNVAFSISRRYYHNFCTEATESRPGDVSSFQSILY